MAGELKVDVHGADAVAASMAAAGRRIETLERANAKAATAISNRARGLAPRRTGRLAASIRPVPGSRSAAAVSAGGGGIRHAAFQEFGTMRNPARKYMYGALMGTQGQWLPEYGREIQQALGTIHGV